jgi:hypothetical protein
MIDSLLADHFEPLSKGPGFRGQGQLPDQETHIITYFDSIKLNAQ